MLLLAIFIFFTRDGAARTPSTDECVDCHADPNLESETGIPVGVNVKSLETSVHADMDCVDCHSQPSNFEALPHFHKYRNVDCADCHEDADASFRGGFHDLARERGTPAAPDCMACHRTEEDAQSDTTSRPEIRRRGLPSLPQEGGARL